MEPTLQQGSQPTAKKQNPPQTLAEPPKPTCKFCQATISENIYFCPTCGKKLKEPPFTFSWPKAIGLILFSILLPPLGIIPGIKYLLIKNRSAKILGISLIVLTIILTFATIFIFMNFVNSLYGSIDSINQTNYLINNSIQDQAAQLQELSQ